MIPSLPKILILAQGLEIGGLENVIYNLVQRVKEGEELKVEICCYDDLGYHSEELKKQNIKVHFLPRKGGIDWVYPFKLSRLIRLQKIDIVHPHNATAWFYGALAAFLTGRPVIYTEHDRSFPSPPRIYWLHNLLSKWTNQIIAVSNEVKSNLEQYESLRNIKVIYNGVDGGKFKPINQVEKKKRRESFGFSDDDLILGTVGRLDSLKNHTILLDVLLQLKEFNPKAKLLIIGNGPEMANLNAKIQKLQLEEGAILLGERQDVAELLSIMDVFVFPSLSEGLPVSVIEAMAAGLPVVASRVGGIPELSTNGKGIILVSPNNLDELVSAIKPLMGNPNLMCEMEEINRQTFKNKFSLDAMVKQYLDVYRSYLGK